MMARRVRSGKRRVRSGRNRVLDLGIGGVKGWSFEEKSSEWWLWWLSQSSDQLARRFFNGVTGLLSFPVNDITFSCHSSRNPTARQRSSSLNEKFFSFLFVSETV